MKKYSTKKKSKLLFLDTHGYDFSRTDLILSMTGIIFLIATVCILHKLNAVYSGIIIISMLIALPVLISSYFMYKAEKKRFDEYCTYFEYMKMYYKTYGKIMDALRETEKQFNDKSKMKVCIQDAIHEIEDNADYHAALGYIDKRYHNTHLERLHSLLIMGEVQGTKEIDKNLDLINYESWRENIIIYQKKKKTARLFLIFFLVFALVTSLMSVFVAGQLETMAQIFNDASYQLYTFIELELILLVFVGIWSYLVSGKWIRGDE